MEIKRETEMLIYSTQDDLGLLMTSSLSLLPFFSYVYLYVKQQNNRSFPDNAGIIIYIAGDQSGL